jgi:hypothetical protein
MDVTETPEQQLGRTLAEKVIEAIEGYPGSDSQKATAAGIVVALVNNYEIEKEEG